MARTFESLDQEWASVAASPDAAAALARWRSAEPALDAPNLAALLGRRRSEDANDVLAALARLAPVDRTACRTLLQMLLPGIASLARTISRCDTDGVAADLVSLAWERIRTYPSTRRGPVAGNVLLDVRKALIASRRMELPGLAEDLTDGLFDPEPSAEDVHLRGSLDGEVARQVRDACDRGAVSEFAVRAIMRTRVDGESLEEAAAAEDVTARVLLLRRWRAERTLRGMIEPLALAG